MPCDSLLFYQFLKITLMAETIHSTIYLIGGVPRTGKTTLAEKIQQSQGISGLELDHVRALFDAQPESPISYAAKASIALVTKQFRPYLEHLMTHLVGSTNNFVINGEIVAPSFVATSSHSMNIRSCFLGISDAQASFENVRTFAGDNDWTQQIPDDSLHKILDKYVRRSEKTSQKCNEYGIRYFDVSSSFSAAHQQAFDYLLSASAELELDEAL
jgi:hypothetical protein